MSISDSLTLDDRQLFRGLMEQAGLEGRYQSNLAYMLYVIGYLAGGSAFLFPYLFFQDPYQCHGQVDEKMC